MEYLENRLQRKESKIVLKGLESADGFTLLDEDVGGWTERFERRPHPGASRSIDQFLGV